MVGIDGAVGRKREFDCGPACAPLFVHGRYARLEVRDGVVVIIGVVVGVPDGLNRACFGGTVFAVVLHDGKIDAAVAFCFLQMHGSLSRCDARVGAHFAELVLLRCSSGCTPQNPA